MCGKCQAEYNKYEKLKAKLEDSLGKVDTCKKMANDTAADFSHVIIDGKSVAGDVISNCVTSLLTVGVSLQSLIKTCTEKMVTIEGDCPGPDHYNPNKNLNKNLNK